MDNLRIEQIQAYRSITYRTNPGEEIKSLEEAINFVNERGFVFLWPIQGAELPSLWKAVAGDRPVANAHDDPGHITWSWKDGSLGKKNWYYGKILRKRATLITFEIVPYFYALSNNFGNPTEDIELLYYEGKITHEVKIIFEILDRKGPMDTISIRRAAQMTSKDSNSRFDRAIALLQSDFKILPVGISDAGGWRYAFIYDLVHRYYPRIPQISRTIKEIEARKRIAESYFRSVGAAQPRDLSKLFSWTNDQTDHTIRALVDMGLLVPFVLDDKIENKGFALKEIFCFS
jgi:hypothetical protein